MYPRRLLIAAIAAVCATTTFANDAAEADPVAANQLRLRDLPTPPVHTAGAAVGKAAGSTLIVGGWDSNWAQLPVATMADNNGRLPQQAFQTEIAWLQDPAAETTWEHGVRRIRESIRHSVERPEFSGDWQSADLGIRVAWPAFASDGNALYLAGGFSPVGISDAVIKIENVNGQWQVTQLPPLPQPLALAGAATMNGRLYVAGGTADPSLQQASAQMWILDLREPAGSAGWESQTLPSEAAILRPTLTVRRDEVAIADALYLLGGWQQAQQPGRWLPNRNGFKYLAAEQSHSGWTSLRPAAAAVGLNSAVPVGPAHIVLSGRTVPDNGLTIDEILQPVAATNQLQLKSYHVFTNRWVALNWPDLGGELPQMIAVDQRWWLLSEREGVPALQSAQLFYAERHFSWLDYAAMCIYLIALVAIGKYFARRDKGTDYFFLGGRKIPWWAAGLSIYATGTSAISFMAIPAKTYMTDWLYFIGMSIFPFFTLILAAYLFIPMLRRLEITTVMEYFDLRFGKSVRFLMSFVGVMGQVAGRMSITLLLPSLALTAVTGMDLYLCILVMGILATIYTVMGGISAVIWTDVLQVAVLFGGAILSFFLIIAKVDGGFGQMITLGINDNKFNFFDFRPDLTTATMWIMLLWAVSDVFGKGLGQEGLQRAFSTPDVKSARRSMITCAVVALPAGFLFYGIGTALYAFYHQHPELLNPTLQSDAIFPLFIAQQLPIGIAGLVISALFAAAMSTLDTAMNSVSAILTRDYYSVFKRDADERSQMRFARWVTISCGVIGTGIALYMASFENLGSLWDRFSIILALIGGGLGGVGALALMTTRANTAGTLLGAALTTVFVYWLRFFAPTIPGISPLHFFAYGTATLAVGFASGYVFSIVISAVFPQYGKKDLTGLTFWTATK